MMAPTTGMQPWHLVRATDTRVAATSEPLPMNDTDRLEGLFQRQHELVWRFALRMTGDPSLAEDLLQETFLRAALHRQRLPREEPAARAWLTRTLVNLCRDRARRHAVRQRHRERAAETSAGSSRQDPERLASARQNMLAALDDLSPRRRAVLVLRELEGLDEKRVAELLGLRPATIRWHLAAARQCLEAKLG